MKTLLLFTLAFGLYAQSPTAIPQAMVKPQAVAITSVQILTTSGAVTAQLDPAGSIILDTSGTTPILRAAPSASVKLPTYDYFTTSAPTQVFTASKPLYSGAIYEVYRSGSLMQPVKDYTVSGQVVTFTSGQTIQAGENITLRYISQ